MFQPPSVSPQVWPVIHLKTPELAYANADIAFRCGCAGVFVISMEGWDQAVTPVAMELKRRYPGKLVGVNYLSLHAPVALKISIANKFDATWTDSPGITSQGVSASALEVERLLKEHPRHLFFGSVAFKYQAAEPDPAKAALLAANLGMIATTSGAATGEPPSAEKLHAIRAALGTAPLAVASGINPDNAYELGRFLTHVLVATGVSKSFYEFDEYLLKQLIEQLRPD